MFETFFRPRIVIPDWETAIAEHEPFIIFSDGLLNAISDIRYGLPKDAQKGAKPGPYVNVDHHSGVKRSITLSACAQLREKLKFGMLDRHRFRLPSGELRGRVGFNHIDEDVFMFLKLLERPELCERRRTHPILGDLVHIVDTQDRYCGSYPYDIDSHRMQRTFAAFEPYNRAKMEGVLMNLDEESMAEIAKEVSVRLDALLEKRGKLLKADTRHHLMDQGIGWALIQEIGAQSRSYFFREKGKQLLMTSMPVAGKAGIFEYRGIKLDEDVPFDTFQAIDRLNQLDASKGVDISATNQWGGTGLFLASPRYTGSMIEPREFKDAMLDYRLPMFEEIGRIPKRESEPPETIMEQLGDMVHHALDYVTHNGHNGDAHK